MRDLIETFIEPLERLGLTYMTTGSVASMLYGEPRFTADVDLVLELPAHDVARFRAAFSTDDFYCPPDDVLFVEAARTHHGHVNVLHLPSALKADVYLAGEDPLHRWALPLRRRFSAEGFALWVAPPEYVIVRKLLFYREGGSSKHLRDVRGILSAQKELDLASLTTRLRDLGLEDLWRTLQP